MAARPSGFPQVLPSPVRLQSPDSSLLTPAQGTFALLLLPQELAYCTISGNRPYEILVHRAYMFCFLFCSFLIKCVFLSHNVIWKQFLPTAGFAFPIGKHIKWKAGKIRVSPESLFPTRLAHVLRLILGLCTSLIKTENVFKRATYTAIPPSEGQHVLWGRNFLKALQIKLTRCRPDCQLPRSPSRMWRPAERHLPEVPTVLVQSGLWGGSRGKPL